MSPKSQPATFLAKASHKLPLYGSTLHYWVVNADRPRTIVLLHGFSGNHLGFKELIKGLDEFRLILPDLPGFGLSSPMSERPPSIAGYADCVEAFLRELHKRGQLNSPPILLGHSLGSVIAARVAAQSPQLIDSHLVLVSPTSTPPMGEFSPRRLGAHLGEGHYWLGLHLPPTLAQRWVTSHTISRVTSALLTKTPDKTVRRAIAQHHIEDLKYLQHADIFYKAYRSLNRDGIHKYASRVNQQTLLIAGQKDEMWPAHTQRQIAKVFPNARLELLPGVGHLTHFEAPQKITRMIREFLN